MTDLASLATLSTADRYAILKADIDLLSKELEKAREEILATGSDRVVGDTVVVEVALSERTALDPKAAKALLTDEQVAACSKTTLITTLSVKPRTVSVIA